jgi:predicted GNAT family acetyltransferase
LTTNTLWEGIGNTVLIFKEAKKEEELVNLSNFDIQAFTDTQDFSWSLDNIKKEVKTGWKLYSVMTEEEIVAAVLVKRDGDALLTKNTPIKMAFQGNGFSHQIKNFYEQEAKKSHIRKVVNFCPVDNFRMIALNESHGYQRTGNAFGLDSSIIEWEKVL